MPAIIYKNAAGKRVPSVTTVLSSLGWSKDGLMYWANSQGLAGKTLQDVREGGTEATIGTICHMMIDAWVHSREFDGKDEKGVLFDAGMLALARPAFGEFERWVDMTHVEILETEASMVSERLQIGGTPDAVGIFGTGKNRVKDLVDWKTSRAVYGDYVLQVLMYLLLWEEKHNEQLDGVHIVRFGKTGGFSHKRWPRAMVMKVRPVIDALLLIHRSKKYVEDLARS